MDKKFLFCLAFFLLIAAFFLTATSTGAVGIKVFPSEVKLKASLGEAVEKEITVENPGNNVTLYEVYPDDFSDWLKIIPASFILESGQVKKVVLELQPKESGVFSTELSVVAKPLSEGKFKANSGVKIPLEIRIAEAEKRIFLAELSKFFEKEIPIKYPLCILGIAFVLCLLIFFFLRQRKNSGKIE